MTETHEFVALGHAGSEAYAGLESFPNPGVSRVEMTSDELTAVCPITNQPDLYLATIEYRPLERCLESKSVKLYLNAFRDEGAFCEALAVRIRDDAAAALGVGPDRVRVTLRQKARGATTITADPSRAASLLPRTTTRSSITPAPTVNAAVPSR